MRDKCFELGTIQAFTDGELGSDQSERILRHVAVCADCAKVLSECEEESSFAFSVLDDELNVLVPTERLRTKVFDSISEIESRRRTGWIRDLATGLVGMFDLRSPGFAAAFTVLIAIGAFALFVNVYRAPLGGNEVAEVNGPVGPVTMVETTPSGSSDTGSQVGSEVPGADNEAGIPGNAPFRATNAAHRVPAGKRERRISGSAAPRGVDAALPEPDIVSEDSYLQTIATLERSVQYGKETLRPSERVAFETDLAVVNDAIVKMRDEVKRNPKNEGAREILKASYQNKVDLLNSVAQKTELIASLR